MGLNMKNLEEEKRVLSFRIYTPEELESINTKKAPCLICSEANWCNDSEHCKAYIKWKKRKNY